jgi:hypothetical protein
LEFYDYFADEYWQIVPIGTQSIKQNKDRPLFFDYSFIWAGIQSVEAPTPPETNDPILSALSIAQPQAISNLSMDLTSTLTNYQSNTLGTVQLNLGGIL